MTELVEYRCVRWTNYKWILGGTPTNFDPFDTGVIDEAFVFDANAPYKPLPLTSMFRRRRLEQPSHEFQGRLLHRVIADPFGATVAAEEVQVLPDQLFVTFMQLHSVIARSIESGERDVLQMVKRHGTLQGMTSLYPPPRRLETLAFWETKSHEMAEATKRRDEGQLERKHYRQIDAYIGPLEPVTSKTTDTVGGIRIAYRATSLLGALWLSWTRSVIPYQGQCAHCGAPLIGNRGMRTCSDYCRKQLSLKHKTTHTEGKRR